MKNSDSRRAKLICSDREISSSQNLPPENPKICLRQFFQCCDSCSVLPPSSFRRLRRLEFCPRIFTDGFAVWILPPTGSLFGASGAKKLQLYLLEPSAREFASGLKICLRRSSLHFSSVLHPCLRRGKSLSKLQRKISTELSSTSATTDSSVGVVLEESKNAKEMDSACTDDVAAARLLIDSKGVKSPAPGFTSSLFWNNSCNDGKVPLLKTVLNSIPGKQHTIQDSLLLKLKRQLPNEFENLTQITTHTFPDLFPIPLASPTNPVNLKSVKNRQHLLDFYDGRFSDKMFIFWLYGILTRHKSVSETCAFFKKNTDARKKYEKLCNDPD